MYSMLITIERIDTGKFPALDGLPLFRNPDHSFPLLQFQDPHGELY
jgi:hypothetical protein